MKKPIDPHIFRLIQERKVLRKKVVFMLGTYITIIAALVLTLIFIPATEDKVTIGVVLVPVVLSLGAWNAGEVKRDINDANRLTAQIAESRNRAAWNTLQKQQEETQQIMSELPPFPPPFTKEP